MSVLVLVDHDRGAVAPGSLEALAFARDVAAAAGESVEALTIGEPADPLAAVIAAHGATVVHQAHHPGLFDYGPVAWGETLAQVVASASPGFVIAPSSDRGNETLAHAAAACGLPAAMNCVSVETGPGPARVRRQRWGGSLLEDAEIDAPVKLLSVAGHGVDPAEHPVESVVRVIEVDLEPWMLATTVTARVERVAGVTLATAPVVVSGGRGVGSADGFAPLEDLASLLGGVVGCSRAVTNAGWRSHSDQVGQTGTRIAPEIYIACGVSGAIQHWVGAMGSKNILAINTDREANIVRKAGYAVIGDLHAVVPAIAAEIRRRGNEQGPRRP